VGKLAAVSRVLDPAEGEPRVARHHTVDENRPGFDAAGRRLTFFFVPDSYGFASDSPSDPWLENHGMKLISGTLSLESRRSLEKMRMCFQVSAVKKIGFYP